MSGTPTGFPCDEGKKGNAQKRSCTGPKHLKSTVSQLPTKEIHIGKWQVASASPAQPFQALVSWTHRRRWMNQPELGCKRPLWICTTPSGDLKGVFSISQARNKQTSGSKRTSLRNTQKPASTAATASGPFFSASSMSLFFMLR